MKREELFNIWCEDHLEDALETVCWDCPFPIKKYGNGWDEPYETACQYDDREFKCPLVRDWFEDHYDEEEAIDLYLDEDEVLED